MTTFCPCWDPRRFPDSNPQYTNDYEGILNPNVYQILASIILILLLQVDIMGEVYLAEFGPVKILFSVRFLTIISQALE